MIGYCHDNQGGDDSFWVNDTYTNTTTQGRL
jgi:hypothetical protein